MMNVFASLLSLPMAAKAAASELFNTSLGLMGKGMLGILLVMCVLYLVVIVLNAATKHSTDN